MAGRVTVVPSAERGLVGSPLIACDEAREARVFFGFHEGMLIALHAIIKKTRKTPAEDLTLARQRLKDIQSWQERKTRT
jgi:phage-related protein